MMDYDGMATKFNGTSWKAINRISMKQDGTSLTLIGFHKRSCNAVECNGIRSSIRTVTKYQSMDNGTRWNGM